MKISVIGGGPGGLYFSILAKKMMPDAVIDVYERNKADDAFGFGVVFSDETLSEFLTRDPRSYELIRSRFAYWDDLDVARNGQKVRITGNGFCGCSRKTLLNLLQQRCQEENVGLHFEHNVTDLSKFHDSDVIVACDGINSAIRDNLSADFGTKIELQRNKFVWLGSTRPLDAFTYWFRTTPYGTFVAHSYQYEKGMSTWIFECSPETWEKAGFETENEETTVEKITSIFAEELDGHKLITNRSHWRQFPAITNEKWHKNNIVLLGDAKATAHYSIGSGTKLAMECAIALADSIAANQQNISAAFELYDKKRRQRVEMIQHAATVSLDWFEHMDRHAQHPFMQFAFGVMTRAKKVTYENLALRDKSFTDKVRTEFLKNQNITNSDIPAAFTPFSLRGMTLQNRIAMAPMEQYSAKNGVVSNWHLVHYGSRAVSGCGLIFTEAVAVSDSARITSGCPMISSEEQLNAWKEITNFVHQNSRAKIAIQLGHAGRRANSAFPWENPKTTNQVPLVSASPIRYDENSTVPKELDDSEMEKIISDFANAAKNADKAGFDMIELQAHHGFLLASFLSPLTNKRSDEYGGPVENRLKFPLKIFAAIHDNFPNEKPISVRISASDWSEGGIVEVDVIAIAQAFKNAGADIISVSTGFTVSEQNLATGRMWQTPFSDAVRNSVNIPTITAGGITDIDQINTILLNGRADIVALGRPFLLDPGFVRSAQAYESVTPDDIPDQYFAGISHLYPLKKSERREKEAMKKALKPESHKKQNK
ncbi:MAG: bifunctional salicylyl-CoA 5-hydroxylase/oxidoreductase [Flavobacterium sp.]|nr:MAG: bifunctional salicylyl-CoA 5-hydroxylase/oxidoreductase [Flavobacterium sp.]